MTVPANPIRKSVHHDVLVDWYNCGWAYICPDFDQPNFYKIEWLSAKAPVEPSNRVPKKIKTENAHERSATRA
jgi:hypothetical protein